LQRADSPELSAETKAVTNRRTSNQDGAGESFCFLNPVDLRNLCWQ
jgi:hypothetical protein